MLAFRLMSVQMKVLGHYFIYYSRYGSLIHAVNFLYISDFSYLSLQYLITICNERNSIISVNNLPHNIITLKSFYLCDNRDRSTNVEILGDFVIFFSIYNIQDISGIMEIKKCSTRFKILPC